MLYFAYFRSAHIKNRSSLFSVKDADWLAVVARLFLCDILHLFDSWLLVSLGNVMHK